MWNHLYQGKKHAALPADKKAMYLQASNEEEKANSKAAVVIEGGEACLDP